MRDIKFRVWDSTNKKLVYLPFKDEGPTIFHVYIYAFRPTDDNIVTQFTGLQDKNGKDIYEGDIINNKKTGTWEVVFHNGSFKFKLIKGKNIYYTKMLRYFDDYEVNKVLEVVGNIYENPELIADINKQATEP